MPLPEASRFPEAAQWAAAALDSLDEKELFCVTQSDLVNLIFESNGEWTGAASELKEALHSDLTPRALSQSLSEIPGICVTKTRTKNTRMLTLSLSSAVGTTGHRLSWPVDDIVTVEAHQPTTDAVLPNPSFASFASICGYLLPFNGADDANTPSVRPRRGPEPAMLSSTRTRAC
jgi:hypothetical protein